MIRFLLGSLGIIYGAGCTITVYKLILMQKDNPFYWYFGMGFTSYFILWVIILRKKEAFWSIVEHELTHALVGFMFRKRVQALNARRNSGGSVRIEGGNLLIALAPYFLPLPAVLVALFLPILKAQFLPYLNTAVGFLYGSHMFPLFKEFHFDQPDIRNSGIILATILTITGNIFFLGIILATLNGNLSDLKAFLLQTFWASMAIFNMIVTYIYQQFVLENLNNPVNF